MFQTLARKITKDKDLPDRVWTLQVLRSVLEGTIYDKLKHSFQEERSGDNKYIPLRDRRPSVRYNLCRMVVQDSVALLFGDGHFPTVELATPEDCETIQEVIKEAKLAQAMHEAAMRGSIGSIAVLMKVLKNRIFFDVMDTDYLTPQYDPEEPDTLASVTEKYKVKGRSLSLAGYTIDANAMDADFWFQRVWDKTSETWYTPLPVNHIPLNNPFKSAPVDTSRDMEIDKERTVKHSLGFVPMVWVKNLPGAKGVDGCSTFRSAIDTQIEIEYQLSQAGRGLKYSSDPLLMIREPAGGDDQQIVRTPTNAIVVAEKGDAKMLEINGTAATAVIEYVKALRESAIESIHGNRSNADKISAAQSGRAMEMMHQSLIWLADQLRTTYGENGLLPLVRMIIAVMDKMPIKVRGKQVKQLADANDATLRWPPWFAATGFDRQQEAGALSVLRAASLISRETAVKSIASSFDIEDVDGELKRIDQDTIEADARAVQMAAQVKATETLPD